MRYFEAKMEIEEYNSNFTCNFFLQWNDGNELSVTGKIKEAIMKLLIQCLPASGVNLAHYLLGFNLKNIKKTILQTPGNIFVI